MLCLLLSPARIMGSATFSSAFMLGMRLNVWKTKPMRRSRKSANCRSVVVDVIRCPQIVISPFVGLSMVPMMFSRDVCNTATTADKKRQRLNAAAVLLCCAVLCFAVLCCAVLLIDLPTAAGAQYHDELARGDVKIHSAQSRHALHAPTGMSMWRL